MVTKEVLSQYLDLQEEVKEVRLKIERLERDAYNLGISKSVSEMTQMEKQQLRVLAILDQSKVSWGDLANRRKKVNDIAYLPSVA